MLKARILLKADASEAGEAWSDSEIARALDTSVNTVARTRQQLVEEGFEAVLTEPPKGRARWTLALLETAVAELNIVDRASDNTIGRTLNKLRSNRASKSNGSSRQMPTQPW